MYSRTGRDSVEARLGLEGKLVPKKRNHNLSRERDKLGCVLMTRALFER